MTPDEQGVVATENLLELDGSSPLFIDHDHDGEPAPHFIT
jgi:hypothetical protein